MLKLLLIAFLFFQTGWSISSVTDITVLPADFPMPDSSAALSPDGTTVAWGHPANGLCIYTLADGQGQCQAWPVEQVRLDRYHQLTWSPDSTQIAFTENFLLFFAEPDLWVYDLPSGNFTNRTPDGVDKIRFGEDSSSQIDYAPTWGLNGELYFFRSSDAGDSYSLELYRLPPDSDTPELVADVSNKFPTLSVYWPPALSPDGTHLAIIVLASDFDDLRNGVWIINLEDGTSAPAANARALWEGFPDWQPVEGIMPLGVTWSGNNALVVHVNSPGEFSASVAQNYHYVDLETRRITPLVDLTVIESQADAFNIGADGHSGIYLMPRLGIVTPDSFIYAHYDVTGESVVSLSSIPLPPTGTAPTVIDDVEGCDIRSLRGDPRVLSTLTAANNALLFNCVVDFSGD